MEVKRTERGWAGHFICSSRCLFRRNTLLEYKDKKVVVSTVGSMLSSNNEHFEEVGVDRYYETMVFESDYSDKEYYDMNVNAQIYTNEKQAISEQNKDNEANNMHENMVEFISKILLNEILTSLRES